jgi:hypothetical protein
MHPSPESLTSPSPQPCEPGFPTQPDKEMTPLHLTALRMDTALTPVSLAGGA